MRHKDIKRDQLQRALKQLAEAVSKPKDQYGRTEIIIQRFELVFELFWKVLKHLLENKGIFYNNPRDVLLAANSNQLIDQDEKWIKMLRDRNLTEHTYNEELAKEIIDRLESIYLPLLLKAHEDLPQE